MNQMVDVAKLVLTKAGLDPALVSDVQLDAAMRRRTMKVCAFEGADYGAVLSSDLAEQQAFLEELLVRESWFFRDRSPFALVKAQARQRPRPLRILSAPCANGEEPYSIAMTLLEEGLTADAFRIDAIDLSLTGLDRARAGVYSARSLREVDSGIREKYFSRQDANNYLISEQIKCCVDFKHGNILDVASADYPQSYDIIFSRNVLIYLSQDAREKVITGFSNLLTHDGLLFVGHAESGLLFNREFVTAGDPGCFAFAKRRAPDASSVRVAAQSKKVTAPMVSKAAISRNSRKPSLKQNVTRPTTANLNLSQGHLAKGNSNERLQAVIASAKQLADQGRYEEARPKVLKLLKEMPGSAEAEHLMGLIYAASGQLVDASRHFERSLYLQPNYRASIEHLSLVMDARGKGRVADRLRDKMARMDATQ